MKKSYPIWAAAADIREPLPTGLQRQLTGRVAAITSSPRPPAVGGKRALQNAAQVRFCCRSHGIHAEKTQTLAMLGQRWAIPLGHSIDGLIAFTISNYCITKILDAIAEGICRAVANFRSRFILYFQSNAIVNFTWLDNPQATHFVEFKACLTREYAAPPPQLCMAKGNGPGLGIVPLRKTPETRLP